MTRDSRASVSGSDLFRCDLPLTTELFLAKTHTFMGTSSSGVAYRLQLLQVTHL